MIIKSNIFKRKIRSLAYVISSRLENNGNPDFNTNGEKVFVENLLRYLKGNNIRETTFFDIGANLGEYTEMLLIRSSGIDMKIHIFEPLRSCMGVLRDKFSKHSEVILNQKAVSDTNGTAEIFYDTEGSSLASLYKRNLKTYLIEMKKSETIETIRLDSYIKAKNICHIDFMKIDVEGHELKALEGMGFYLRGDFVDFIQFEYGGANLDSHTNLAELFELFKDKGFEVGKIMPKGVEIRSYEPWMDNFQYANYVAISQNVMKKIYD